jgi:hypothetical protein
VRFHAPYRRNQPVKLNDPRPVDRDYDSASGNAGRDGYSRLSQADRETGHRPPVGGEPMWPGLRFYED